MGQQPLGSVGTFGRREFLRAMGVAAGTGLLVACQRADTGTASSPTSPGAPEPTRPPIEQEPGNLEIFDWAGYGDGAYGDDVLWKTYAKAFPEQKPSFTTFKDDDSGYAKVASGASYDLVHPCAYRFQDWVNLGVLQPWDTSLIANYSSMNPALQATGSFDGQQYFIVPDWGFAAPMYRADQVQPTEDSWGLLWDERYAGKISWWDSLNMLVVAAYFNGVADPWAMTDEELEAQKDFLTSKVNLVRDFWDLDPTPDIQNNDVWITYAWQNHWWAAKDYGEGDLDVVYMDPKEGRTSWYCGFALFGDSQNYHHAHEYVNAWSGTQAAEWLITNYAYGHTNTDVDLSKVPQELVDTFSLDDPSVLEEPNSHPERPIERRDVYEELWLEVKAAA
jgi:spermidine/putrescine transport system substrate-binding protein